MTGIVNQKLDPTFSSDWTPIAPPMSLTSCLDIDKPKPVPPNLRVDEFYVAGEILVSGVWHRDQLTSACWNGTNNNSTSDGDSPMPVSLRPLSNNAHHEGNQTTHSMVNLRFTTSSLAFDVDVCGLSIKVHVTWTDPRKVNFTAFPIRFINTWRIRA